MARLTVVAVKASAVLLVVFVLLHLFLFDLPFDLGGSFIQGEEPATQNDLEEVAPDPDEPLARQILASELLSRPPAFTGGRVPKLFHQSWKSLDLPTKFDAWSRSCRRHHRDWEWVVWTDEDNLRLVQMHFPWLENTYRALPSEIYRADLARYLYMYIYGGVYADLDTECLRPTESLEPTHGHLFNATDRQNNTALFGRMGTDPGFEHSIPNAWMAATPGHLFFLLMTRSVERHFEMQRKAWWQWSSPSPESMTGPVALRAAIAEYEKNRASGARAEKDLHTVNFVGEESKSHQVVLLPSHVVYPFSWGPGGEKVNNVCWVVSNRFNANACKKRLDVEGNGSIAITYWSHTHSPSGHNKSNMKHIE